MRNTVTGLLLLSLLIGGHAADAAAAPVSPRDARARLKVVLEERLPGSTLVSVEPSALPGIYEVATKTEIFYADATGDYVIAGPLLDARTKENVTATRWDRLHAIDFNVLPLDKAIKTVKGDGSRKLAVFADPECPYCQRLEQSMKSVSDVTVYTFLFPLDNLHPGASERAHSIWCSGDRPKAWYSWLLDRVAAPLSSAGKCDDDPTEALRALAEKLGVNATPTLFFADGHRRAGALSADDLEKQLADHRSVGR